MSQKVGYRDGRLKSKGCFSCIRMKVKCDASKPQCQRCRMARRVCPGYRDPNALVFRMETPTVSSPSRSATTKRAEPPQPLCPPVSTDWTTSAVSHFFYNFTLPAQKRFAGFYEFLPLLYLQHPDALHLRSAVDAVAMANLAQVKQMGDSYLHQARRAYGAALRRLGEALNRGESASPTALATVSLLWMYDVVMGEDRLGAASPHHQGELEILRLRLSQINGDRWINRSVLAGVRMQQIGIVTDDELVGPPPPPAALPGLLLLEGVLPRVASVLRTTPRLLQKEASPQTIADHDVRLRDVHRQLLSWENDLPEDWKYKTTLRSGNITFPSMRIIMPGLCPAGQWMAYWLARLAVLRDMTRLRLSGRGARLQAPSLMEIRNDILTIVDYICSSAAYVLGHDPNDRTANVEGDMPAMGAFFLTNALAVCGRIPIVPIDQKEWVFECLNYIGHAKGIRKALVLRADLMKPGAGGQHHEPYRPPTFF